MDDETRYSATKQTYWNKLHLGREDKRIAVGLALATLLYWGWVWRVPMLRPDDYMFASRSGLPSGGVYYKDVLSEAWRYVNHVNGRLSDAVTQVLLSSVLGTAVFLASLHAVAAYITYLWLNRLSLTEGRATYLFNALLSFCAPFMLLIFDPLLGADLFHFTAGTVSTVGGYACALWTLWYAVNVTEEGKRGRSFWIAAGVFAGAGMLHELSSFFLIPALTVLIVSQTGRRKKWTTFQLLWPLIVLVIARLLVPGLWRRVDVVNANVYGAPEAAGRYDRLFIGLTGGFENALPLNVLFVFLMLLVYVAYSYFNGVAWRKNALVCIVCFGLVSSWVALGNVLNVETRHRLQGGIENVREVSNSISGMGFVLISVLVLTMTALILLRFRAFFDHSYILVLWSGGTFTAMIPWSLGNSFGRQFYFNDAILLLGVCVFIGLLAYCLYASSKVLTSWVLVAVVSIFALSSVLQYSSKLSEAMGDYRSFLDQVQAVRDGKQDTIDLTGPVRQPSIYSPEQLGREDLPENLILYYELPAGTTVILP